MNFEETIMHLITKSGGARSNYLMAIKHARKGAFDVAAELMESASAMLLDAHKSQTQFIQEEADGRKVEISLLMVHAQDHLMNAMTIRDLAVELIEDHKERFHEKV